MSRNYAEILEGKYIKDDESCHFGDCTEKTTDIIFKLFQPATQKESKAVSLFLLTISLLSSFLTLCIKARESSWPQLQSSTSKGRGGCRSISVWNTLSCCLPHLLLQLFWSLHLEEDFASIS